MTVENEQAIEQIPEVIDTIATEGSAPPEPAEKIFNAKTVSAIVAREREKAFEKGKREALMELNQQQQEQAQPDVGAQQAQQGGVSLGGMQQFSPEQMMQMVQEKLPQMMEQHIQSARQEQVINSFVTKMRAAEEKYPGLEQDLGQVNWDDPRSSALAVMANDLENAGDVMKDLLDNPSKFGHLLNLVGSQPRLAAKELFSLSNSIKQNQKAVAENKRAHEPMSQMKPSLNAGLDDSNASVSDFRKMQW